MKAEIWIANWIFFFDLTAKEKKEGKKAPTYIVEGVVTRRIPVRFVINEEQSYIRAIKSLKSSLSDYQTDKSTGLKKFEIVYTQKIGETNV